MCVIGALFGSAPEVVAEGLNNIVKEMVCIVGGKRLVFFYLDRGLVISRELVEVK